MSHMTKQSFISFTDLITIRRTYSWMSYTDSREILLSTQSPDPSAALRREQNQFRSPFQSRKAKFYTNITAVRTQILPPAAALHPLQATNDQRENRLEPPEAFTRAAVLQ